MMEFFKDDVGALSCTRLLVFLVIVTVLAVWVWGNIQAGRFVPLPLTEAGVITACVFGKNAHGYYEYGAGSARVEAGQ